MGRGHQARRRLIENNSLKQHRKTIVSPRNYWYFFSAGVPFYVRSLPSKTPTVIGRRELEDTSRLENEFSGLSQTFLVCLVKNLKKSLLETQKRCPESYRRLLRKKHSINPSEKKKKKTLKSIIKHWNRLLEKRFPNGLFMTTTSFCLQALCLGSCLRVKHFFCASCWWWVRKSFLFLLFKGGYLDSQGYKQQFQQMGTFVLWESECFFSCRSAKTNVLD